MTCYDACYSCSKFDPLAANKKKLIITNQCERLSKDGRIQKSNKEKNKLWNSNKYKRLVAALSGIKD